MVCNCGNRINRIRLIGILIPIGKCHIPIIGIHWNQLIPHQRSPSNLYSASSAEVSLDRSSRITDKPPNGPAISSCEFRNYKGETPTKNKVRKLSCLEDLEVQNCHFLQISVRTSQNLINQEDSALVFCNVMDNKKSNLLALERFLEVLATERNQCKMSDKALAFVCSPRLMKPTRADSWEEAPVACESSDLNVYSAKLNLDADRLFPDHGQISSNPPVPESSRISTPQLPSTSNRRDSHSIRHSMDPNMVLRWDWSKFALADEWCDLLSVWILGAIEWHPSRNLCVRPAQKDP